ncbi:ferritin-like domain-containing protein [Nostocales cyanobacterium LEGE 11386]|nr:ferritin-like domain-containing protein [Nostocales cyanobacterium LEGE 11386]
MVQLSERPGTQKITNLQQKFTYEVGAMYDSENRFLEAMQMMCQCCQNNQLKSLMETHIRETEQQIQNLEQVFKILGQEPQRVNCDSAAGLVSDGQKLMLLAADNPKILDLALTGAQAKVENLEIACYRGMIKVAEQMNQNQVVQLLQQNLQQEEQTAQKIEQCMPQLLQEAKSAGGSTSGKSR